MLSWAFRLGGIAALALAACAGPSVLVVGEGVRPPEAPPPVFEISILADDDLTPLVADVETNDEQELELNLAGRGMLTWLDEPIEITATAPGFHPASTTIDLLPEEGPVELRLAPVVLTGTVVGPNGQPLPGSTVRLGDLSARTEPDGGFRFIRATPGRIEVTRPAWEGAEVSWNGVTGDVEVAMEPRMIKALRVQARKTGDPDDWQAILDLAARTEVNALVIDTKDERGNVFHDTSVATAHQIGAVRAIYDLDDVLADMDEAGLYKITRIVTFQDPYLAPARPSIAARNDVTGQPWVTYSERAWLDPTDRDAWEYPLALAVEACERGFDEIQFDYVRFPSDGPVGDVEFDDFSYESREQYYSPETVEMRVSTISAFLSEAHSRLNPMGCAVAADIFAITLESRHDEGIGQLPNAFASSLDVISPMIYSYAYGPDWECANPNDCAPAIVARALDAGIKRLDAAGGFAFYRPWLQRAFISSEEVLAVQQEAEDRNFGWMIWSENTQFEIDMFDPAETE